MAYKGWVLYRMTVEVSVVLYHFWLVGFRFNEFWCSVQWEVPLQPLFISSN